MNVFISMYNYAFVLVDLVRYRYREIIETIDSAEEEKIVFTNEVKVLLDKNILISAHKWALVLAIDTISKDDVNFKVRIFRDIPSITLLKVGLIGVIKLDTIIGPTLVEFISWYNILFSCLLRSTQCVKH